MSLDNILQRRALRLKAELSESGPKSSILSIIYPATDHGKNMPPVVKTPSSIPSPNDKSAKEVVDDQPEKKQKAKDGPGTSKAPDIGLPVSPSTAVPPEHKKAAFELGYFGEDRSKKFIERCVQLITGVTKLEQSTEVKPDVPCDTPSCPPAPVAEASKSRLAGVVSKFQKGKPAAGHD